MTTRRTHNPNGVDTAAAISKTPDDSAKQRKAAYNRAYYLQNREHLMDKRRQYIADNPIKIREQNQRYYREHRDFLLAYYRHYRAVYPDKSNGCARRYYRKNRQKVLQNKRRYYQKNRTHILIRNAEYQQSNPDKMRIIKNRRRVRKMGNGGTHTATEWRELCDRHGNVCLACGASGNLTLDHVVPIVRGGTDDISNAQPLCRTCNSRKGARVIDYRPTVSRDTV